MYCTQSPTVPHSSFERVLSSLLAVSLWFALMCKKDTNYDLHFACSVVCPIHPSGQTVLLKKCAINLFLKKCKRMGGNMEQVENMCTQALSRLVLI